MIPPGTADVRRTLENPLPNPNPESVMAVSTASLPCLDEAATASDPAARSEWDAGFFAWGIWALSFLAALWFVHRYGSNCPYFDEWDWLVPMVARQNGAPPMAGREDEGTLNWLWKVYGYSHFPLTKVVLLGLLGATGTDFRTAMYFHVCILGALALALIRVARELRGQSSYADAVFPLLLLHWGRQQIMLTNMQMINLLPMCLAGALLVIVLRQPARPTVRLWSLAGLCLLLLPLCGGAGVLLVPPFAIWFAFTGFCWWRSGEGRANAGGVLTLAFLAAVTGLLLVYFITGEIDPQKQHDKPSREAIVLTAIDVYAVGLGTGGQLVGPYLEKPYLLGAAVGVLLVLAMAVLALGFFLYPAEERPRLVGLFFYLGFVLAFGLQVGYLRTGLGFQDYYGLQPALGICVLYFVAGLYLFAGLGRIVQMGLFTLAAGLLVLQIHTGQTHAMQFRGGMYAFEEDLQKRQPSYILVARHFDALSAAVDTSEGVSLGLEALRQARVGPFALISEDPTPTFVEEDLPVIPADMGLAVGNAFWEQKDLEGTLTGDGTGDPYVELALPEPRFVGGIRIRYLNYSKPDALFRVYWKPEDQPEFPPKAQYCRIGLPPDDSITIWVGEKIDRFRIHPDLYDPGCVYHIAEIKLLVPQTKPLPVAP